jgi:hypothetical protein
LWTGSDVLPFSRGKAEWDMVEAEQQCKGVGLKRKEGQGGE